MRTTNQFKKEHPNKVEKDNSQRITHKILTLTGNQ